MWRIGFGLERIGLLALARPLLATAFLLLLCAVAVINVHRLSFDGSVLSVLPDRSQAYQDFEDIGSKYRHFARDVTVLVESDRLRTAAGLEDLRNLQLDLALADDVSHAVSVFSTPDFDPQTGEPREWFPPEFADDAQATGLIESLITKYPQAGSLISLERGIAVIIVSLTTDVEEDDEKSFLAYRNLRNEALAIAPDDFKLYFTGLTPVGATILSTLISDQALLTSVGMFLGTAIAFYIFKSLLAAVVCALPPGLTALWAFGLFSMMDIPINYLTTVLPTLALILAFADGIFLYFRWQTLCAHGDAPMDALKQAISKVGPASALTSITTAVAFLSFSYADSDALNDFAFLGASVVTLAFIAVIVGVPVVLYWAIRLGLAGKVKTQVPMFQQVGRRARRFSMRFPLGIFIGGILLTLALGIVQTWVNPEYRLTDYLPKDSEVREGETLANDITGGRALLLVSVPFGDGESFSSAANRERLAAVNGVLVERFGTGSVFSAHRVLEQLETPEAFQRLNELALEASDNARSDFLSETADAALVTVRLPSDLSVVTVREHVDAIRASLAGFEWSQDVLISGFPVLMSVEFTRLIDQLRTSLMIAIGLGILIVGVATRSPFITLAAITPNLLPVFFVMFVLYMRGATVNLSEVVALTIAFGIAIDNAVHLINVHDAQRRLGKRVLHSISSAVDEVGPALTAGTVIICVSILVTQISSLPVVPVLGQLMISTLIVALLANLLILPSNILTLERLRQMISGERPRRLKRK